MDDFDKSQFSLVTHIKRNAGLTSELNNAANSIAANVWGLPQAGYCSCVRPHDDAHKGT